MLSILAHAIRFLVDSSYIFDLMANVAGVYQCTDQKLIKNVLIFNLVDSLMCL